MPQLSLADIESHPLYAICTLKERKFIEHYIALDGDIVEAARAAYGDAGSRLAQRVKFLMSLTRIVKLLAMIDGSEMPSFEDILRQYWLLVQTAESDRTKKDTLDSIVKLLNIKPVAEESLADKMRKIDDGVKE